MLADYDSAYGLRSVSLRYFNAAGADPEGDLGERHDPESHLILLVLQAASGRRNHIAIYNSGIRMETPHAPQSPASRHYPPDRPHLALRLAGS
jgi:UDP-glucose 4-epimerase